ncbi:MAG: PorT family protein [Cytophagales bacterium]|nr:PorT family protein [Cytophagales bacterium]
MKTGIEILALIFLAGASFAQPRVHLGITTGFNSTHVLDKGLSTDPRYVAKANYEWAPVGASAGIDFTNRFGLQIESIKAAQGQIYQMIETAQNIKTMIAERNIDLSYIQLPLLMKMMSGGNGPARFNFQIGPQLSLLNSGSEVMKCVKDANINLEEGGDIPLDVTTVIVENSSDVPLEYRQALASGEVSPPSNNELEIPISYFEDMENPGQYNMPENSMMTLMNSEVESGIQKFKEKEVQLAFGLGMDIDVLKHFYISANVRANYSFTDMRNQDLIDMIGDEDITSIFNNRANLLVGAQLGLHWIIGGNRSFKAKKEAEAEDIFR